MRRKTVLIGGPRDGEELELGKDWDLWRINVPSQYTYPLAIETEDLRHPIRPSSIDFLVYHLVLAKDGNPSIDDQGRYRHKL